MLFKLILLLFSISILYGHTYVAADKADDKVDNVNNGEVVKKDIDPGVLDDDDDDNDDLLAELKGEAEKMNISDVGNQGGNNVSNPK
uniref:Hypotheticial protein n=1 Tax=Schistosoma japonicum TaxID=6182 RepID=C1LFR9_SCHJA|nr:hypotheticial protein [Schistosoma japonicum]